MSDQLMELPEGWEWTTEDIAEVVRGASPRPAGNPKYFGGDVPWITVGSLTADNNPYLTSVSEFVTEEGRTKSRYVEPETLLLTNSGATLGVPKITKIGGCINDGSLALQYVDYPLKLYLYYFFTSLTKKLRTINQGAAQPNLNTTIVKAIDIPLPPLNEQKRIVAKIEELRERSQKARSALSAIPELCDKFRQSVLAAAFRGDLTADWREQNPDVEFGINRWRLKSLPLESDNLPEIPETWSYRKLDDISERVSVGHVGPTSEYYCDSATGVPFLRSQNVRPGRLDLAGLQYITKDFHEQLRKSQLQPGDLLIVRVGANRGDTCILPDDMEAVNCANIVFARPYKGISNYLNIYFQSKFCQETLQGLTTSSAQGVINTKSVAEVPVLIPPEEEQKEIITSIQAFLTAIGSIEQQYQQSVGRLEYFDRSILAKAFRGELVEQDPNDEPTSIMLERIRAEREQQVQGKVKKPGKKGQRKITAEGSDGAQLSISL